MSAIAAIGSALAKSAKYWVPALTSIGTTALQSRRAREESRKTREFDVAQMESMREYNHPFQQKQRLIDAGLNPMLVYGEGTAGATGQQAAPVTGEYREPPAVDPFSVLQQTMDIRQQSEQIEYQKRRIQSEMQNRWLIEAKQNNIMMDTNIKQMQDYFLLETLDDRRQQETAERIYKEARAGIERKYEEWANMGINPKDATWVRLTIELLKNLGVADARIENLFKGLIINESIPRGIITP